MSQEEQIHQAVLCEPVIEFLQGLHPLIDCTLGAGGHLARLLQHLPAEAQVMAIDRDKEILRHTREKIETDQVHWVHGRFADVDHHTKRWGQQPKAILADLGVSSWQIDQPQRGFSFQREGPLDMRMDQTQKMTAITLIHELSEKDLGLALQSEANERHAFKIAKALKAAVQAGRLKTTMQLAHVIHNLMPSRAHQRKDPATQTFLALRRLVNQEDKQLEALLQKAPDLLQSGGRLAIISFHSLEDRQVKLAFNELARDKEFKVLTPKPILPEENEIRQNRRARSACLRVLEKL